MITEDCVSFETAKLLKEKGFEGAALYYYDENGGFASYCDSSAWSALESILTFVSGLEKSEKPINQEGLENEAVSYCFDNGLNISPRVATDFARYFYDLGCRRTAEKYDEIEYNRQREAESRKSR